MCIAGRNVLCVAVFVVVDNESVSGALLEREGAQ
jgi:hypothetical protein